jgi:hypothetical protein
VALLSATIGVSVQQVYCYCTGHTTIGWLMPEPACTNEQVVTSTDACTADSDRSCCAMPSPLPTAKTSCCEAPEAVDAPHNCQHKTSKIYKLDTDYTFEALDGFKHSDECPCWISSDPFFARWLRKAICVATPSNKAPPQPPDPPSGRVICIRHQLYRC